MNRHSHVGKGRCTICGRFYRPFKAGDVVMAKTASSGVWTMTDPVQTGYITWGALGIVKYDGSNLSDIDYKIVDFDSEGDFRLFDTLLDTDIELVQGAQ